MAKSDRLIIKEILKLKNRKNYKKIEKGFFKNIPEIEGYIVELDTFEERPIFIILNTNKDYNYKKEYTVFDKYSFIIFNVSDLNYFINNLTKYLSNLIDYFKDILKNVKIEEIHKEDGLPFGYEYDEKENIIVNKEEASIVAKAFKEYISLQSIRKVASSLKSSYSVIRDILYDERYARMPIKIVPDSYLKRVYQIMQENRKNKQGRISDKSKQYEVKKNRISNIARTKITDKLFNKDEKNKEAEERERN